MTTIRLTMAQALARFLASQMTEIDGETVPLFAGVWAIFGHGNVAGFGEALYAVRDELPTFAPTTNRRWRMPPIAFAKASFRRRMMAVTSSIGPGATNMVTAAALAHVNRLPVLLLPGDVFANRRPDPVLQQVEDFGDGTVSANDCFRPVSRYFDRITRPEQIIPALHRAMAVLTDPAECGPVTLSLCQDVQAEAYDYPASFFDERIWTPRRMRPSEDELAAAIAALRARREAADRRRRRRALFRRDRSAEGLRRDAIGIPVSETQAGKSSLPAAHPLNMGSIGVTGTSASNQLAEEADVILAVGSRLQDFTTGSWALFQNSHQTVIGLNTQVFDATKHRALPLVADALAGLKDISADLGGWRAPDSWTRARRGGPRGLVRRRRQGDRPTNAELPSDGQVIGAVQRVLGPRGDARLRLGRTARRIAQALAGRRARLLPSRLWLLDHGLRDRRRARRQDGEAGRGGRRHARRRLLSDDEFRDRDLGHAGPEAHHRRARQFRLRLHQPAADGDRRRQLQQSLEGYAPSRFCPLSISPRMPRASARSRRRSPRSPSWKRRWPRRRATTARRSSSSTPTR